MAPMSAHVAGCLPGSSRILQHLFVLTVISYCDALALFHVFSQLTIDVVGTTITATSRIKIPQTIRRGLAYEINIRKC